MIINIAECFTKTPGGRYREQGSFSGEEFRENILFPALRECKESGADLVVDLDGGFGYGIGFLRGAFEGLAKVAGYNFLMEKLKIKSEEEPALLSDINEYIFFPDNI